MNGVRCTCKKSSTPLVFTPINEKSDFNLTTQTFIMKLNTSHRQRMSFEVCGRHRTFILRQRCTVYFFFLKKSNSNTNDFFRKKGVHRTPLSKNPCKHLLSQNCGGVMAVRICEDKNATQINALHSMVPFTELKM